MRRKELTSFDALNKTVRPESRVVQEHYGLIDNCYKQKVEIHSPDIDTFYNFISNIPVYKFKNQTANQWNYGAWITPEELKL